MDNTFDPSGIGMQNGNIFGFPYTTEEAELIIIPVPWEVTTSYGGGTADGPEAVLRASTQLDFYSPYLPNAWKYKTAMLPISQDVYDKNSSLRNLAEDYIGRLENGESADSSEGMKKIQKIVNDASESLNGYVKSRALEYLENGIMIGLLGGDHSTPFGLISALAEKEKSISILQIDAHADLRVAYEGFAYSHASIMQNALQIEGVEKLVQLGIRDVCPDEIAFIHSNPTRISCFFDWDIKSAQFTGTKWHKQCEKIIEALGENVYISFDIDGLHPSLCPNTGTPVAGGFQLEEMAYLLNMLAESNKKIVGFDLCEVGPGANEWDANVGARVLYLLCCMMHKNRH